MDLKNFITTTQQKMACTETRILRTFAPADLRHRTIDTLLRKYADGRRSARHVYESIAALRAQNRYAEADEALLHALDVVRPVPTVLWTLACDRLRYWDVERTRGLLRIARDDPRYVKHLSRSDLTSTTHGLVALMHEASSERSDWSLDMLGRALETMRRT